MRTEHPKCASSAIEKQRTYQSLFSPPGRSAANRVRFPAGLAPTGPMTGQLPAHGHRLRPGKRTGGPHDLDVTTLTLVPGRSRPETPPHETPVGGRLDCGVGGRPKLGCSAASRCPFPRQPAPGPWKPNELRAGHCGAGNGMQHHEPQGVGTDHDDLPARRGPLRTRRPPPRRRPARRLDGRSAEPGNE